MKTMSRRKQSNPKPLLKRDDEDFTEEQQTGDQQQNSTIDADMKDVSNSPTRSETPILAESPTPSQASVKSMKSPSRPQTVSPSVSEQSSIDNKYLDVELELAKSMHSTIVSAASTIANTVTATNASVNKTAAELSPKPKLRLNTVLAADPATNPDAKEIKTMCSEKRDSPDTDDNKSIHRSDGPQPIAMNIVPVTLETSNAIVVTPRIAVYTCVPCGIKFSSASTLDAHQTYYCSHRKDTDEPTPALPKANTNDNSGEPPTKAVKTGKQYACTQCSYSADKKVSLNRHMRMHQTSPSLSSTTSNGADEINAIVGMQPITPQPATIIPAPVDRYCSDCDIRFSSTKTYRAHKQHYCQSRHREGLPNTASKPSSQKSGSQSPNEVVRSPPEAPSQPFLALPTNPIIIVPYSIFRNASVIPLTSLVSNTTSNPDSTCFVLQNGTLSPIAYSLAAQVAVQQSQVPSQCPSRETQSTGSATQERPESVTNRSAEVLKDANKKTEGGKETTTPLDLSVRRLSPALSRRERSLSLASRISSEQLRAEFECLMESKENLSVSDDSVTPEQIVCAPSLPGSPPLTPSPKRRSNSPRAGSASISPIAIPTSPLLMRSQLPPEFLALRLTENPALVNELRMRLSAGSVNNETSQPSVVVKKTPVSPSPVLTPVAPLPPQIYVKKGSSKCIECNIVFVRQENYIAHKKHYCSARNLDDTDTNKVSPPVSPNQSSPKSTVSYQQLICAACGIKFTSLDNLSAHQMYYCPKRIELQVQQQEAATAVATLQQKQKCAKCKTSHEPGHPCSANNSNAYKCPMCDVVSPNSAEARRHIETHGGIKAFRCSLCRYKGNTLRGMRTHIRMHFDKKSGECNEENYIISIIDEDRIEIPPNTPSNMSVPTSPAPQVIASPNATEILSPNQMFFCDLCNYSSTYKGNVVRHAKLVHQLQQGPENSTSPMIGEGGESLTYNGDTATDELVHSIQSIKKEPEDERKIEEPEVVIEEQPELVFKTEAKTTPEPDPQLNIKSPEQMIDSKVGDDTYCEKCNIKFKFMNSYLAHKQNYCKDSNIDSNVLKSDVLNSYRSSSNETTVL